MSGPVALINTASEKWAGRQFDPEVVRIFLSMPENIWEDLRKEIDSRIMFRFAATKTTT